MRDYAAMAKASGFTDAAVLPVRELVVVPEYRRFCAQTLCGNYGVLPACPPMSGTVEEMTARVRQYETALVLMVEHTPKDYTDRQEQKAAKRHQNELTEQLINRMICRPLCGRIKKNTAQNLRRQKQERNQDGLKGYRIADLPALRRIRHAGV